MMVREKSTLTRLIEVGKCWLRLVNFDECGFLKGYGFWVMVGKGWLMKVGEGWLVGGLVVAVG